MEPYRVHLDDWVVAMYPTDDGRLTFTVNHLQHPDRLTQIVGEVRLRRHYIGSVCAGDLHPSPFEESKTKEAILAAQGCG